MSGQHCYEHPRPALTVDCVVFGWAGGELQLLVIERRLPPFVGAWALPGGFVQMHETTEAAAARELAEEAGIENIYMEQLFTFSRVDRDPRERVVSVAYYGLVRPDTLRALAGSDAARAEWVGVGSLPELAFDHREIVDMGLVRLRGKLRYQPVGFELLPTKFTLSQLQGMYEQILGRTLDKRNFRRVMLRMEILDRLDEKQRDVSHRPSQLFSFNRARYDELVESGFNFEV